MPTFHVLETSIDLIRLLNPLVEPLRTRDPSLDKQIRNAANSTVLNIAQGNRRIGKDRLQHLRVAAGSAAEVRAALQVAMAWGDLDSVAAAPAAQSLERILAMLWRLSR